MFSACSRVIPMFYVVLSRQAQNHKKTGISFCFVTILTSFVHQEKQWLHTHHDTHSQHQTTHIPLPPPPSETHIIPRPPKAAPWPIVLPLHSITTHIAPAGGCNWIHDEDTLRSRKCGTGLRAVFFFLELQIQISAGQFWQRNRGNIGIRWQPLVR